MSSNGANLGLRIKYPGCTIPPMTDEASLWDPLLAEPVQSKLKPYDPDKVTVNREHNRSLIQQVFEDLGGRARMAAYFNENYPHFVQVFGKFCMPNPRLEIQGDLNITIRPAIPPSTLDGEFYDVQSSGSSGSAAPNDSLAGPPAGFLPAPPLNAPADSEGATIYRFDKAANAGKRSEGRRGRDRPSTPSGSGGGDSPPDGWPPGDSLA